jgi:hypothetical protein
MSDNSLCGCFIYRLAGINVTNGDPRVSASRRLAPTVEGSRRTSLAKYEKEGVERRIDYEDN